MKAKHHIRKGRTLMFPDKPAGPQNPWVDPAKQRPRPLEDMGPATQPKNLALFLGVKRAVHELERMR